MIRVIFLTTFLAFLIPSSLCAQTEKWGRGYEGYVELYGGAGSSTRSSAGPAFGLQWINAYRFGDFFTLGLGIGYFSPRNTVGAIPIFLDARWDLVRKPDATRPFLAIGIGYGIIGKANAQAAIGVRGPLSPKLQFVGAVGLRVQGNVDELYGSYYPENYIGGDLRLGIAF